MAVVLRPGDVIAGKYRVLHEIGRGGMGVVVAADHLLLPQQVAIKLLKRDADAVSLARFEREAHVVVQLRSEHVCRVLDVGALDGGEPFIVMELLHGCDLATWVEREGPLPVSQAVDYLLQACEALAEAHVRGVVHRDLKPSNLFLTEGVDGSPLVKVLDFGISKAHVQQEGNQGALTDSGTILGSPRFMAPEQLMSTRKSDHRTDVWALGVVLHELLTGRAAFDGDTAPELFVSILRGEPRPIGEIAPHVPDALVQVILRCTRKRPDDRYANVGALAVALGRFAPPASSTIVARIVRTLELHGWSVMSPDVVVQADAAIERVDDSAATVAASNDEPRAALARVTTDRAPARSGAGPRGLWLGLTVGVALTLLVVGVVVVVGRHETRRSDGDETISAPTTSPPVSTPPPTTCYFELCDPAVTIPLGAPVEPEVLLPTVLRRAKQLEPEAALVNISTTPIVAGAFSKDMPGSINYIFRYPKADGTHATVHIGVGPTMLFGRHGPDVGLTLVEPPRCPLQKALAAGQKAGLEPTKEIVAVWGAFGPVWMLNQTSPAKVVGIDDDCRETSLVH